jgi:adenine-specific DNA glycosylase
MVFGHTTIAVDTHIFRVSNRTGIAPGKNPREVEDELNAVTPDAYKRHAHHWLLLHGRYVCVARLPACPKCIIADLCEYTLKTPPKELPKSEAPVAHEKGKGRVSAAVRANASRVSAARASVPRASSTNARKGPASAAPAATRAKRPRAVTRSRRPG